MALMYACRVCGRPTRGQYCARHQGHATLRNYTEVYNTRRWRALRGLILERDGYQCQRNLPGCKHHARSVGHILPFTGADDDLAWNEDNLQAECSFCNGTEAASRQHAGRRG